MVNATEYSPVCEDLDTVRQSERAISLGLCFVYLWPARSLCAHAGSPISGGPYFCLLYLGYFGALLGNPQFGGRGRVTGPPPRYNRGGWPDCPTSETTPGSSWTVWTAFRTSCIDHQVELPVFNANRVLCQWHSCAAEYRGRGAPKISPKRKKSCVTIILILR